MNTSTWWKQTPDDLIHFVWPKWTSTHPHTMPNGWYACGQNTMYVDKKTQFHCIPVPQLTMVVSYVLNHSRASTWHSSHYGSCREGSHMSAFSWGRGALKGVSSMVFPNLRRMQEYWNLSLHKQLPFYFLGFSPFIKKKYLYGNMGIYKIWGAAPA